MFLDLAQDANPLSKEWILSIDRLQVFKDLFMMQLLLKHLRKLHW